MPTREVKDTRNDRLRDLRSAYNRERQIGLVLGAGVTVGSNVPNYDQLALKLLDRAIKSKDFTGSCERRKRLEKFVKKEIGIGIIGYVQGIASAKSPPPTARRRNRSSPFFSSGVSPPSAAPPGGTTDASKPIQTASGPRPWLTKTSA